MVLACSRALLQRLDEYPLKSVKDLFTTPATEGKEKVREEIEVYFATMFWLPSVQGYFNENDSTYRNELGLTFNPLNLMLF